MDYLEKGLMYMESKNIVILYSGGLDSMVMNVIARKNNPDANIKLIYYNIGQKYAHKEMSVLPSNCEVHDLSWFSAKEYGKDMNSAGNIYIPGRNMLFATLAACQYLPDEIWLGALMGEIHQQATDKNLIFKEKFNNTLEYVMSPFGAVKLVYPFVDMKMGKYEVVEYAYRQGLESEILESSSCMDALETKCGKCIVCSRRWAIMMGISESLANKEFTSKESPINFPDPLKYYISVISDSVNGKDHYDEYRVREISIGLKKYFKVSNDLELLEILKLKYSETLNDKN